MKIKLSQEIADSFIDLGQLEAALMHMALVMQKRRDDLFNALKKLYPDLEFSGARLDHKTSELTLPFEKDSDFELSETKKKTRTRKE